MIINPDNTAINTADDFSPQQIPESKIKVRDLNLHDEFLYLLDFLIFI